MIVRGRNSSWSIVGQTVTTDSFRDIEEFAGDVYVCSSRLLYKLGGTGLVPVLPEYPIGSFSRLKSTGQVILSVGLKDAAVFDGESWQQLF